MFNYVATYNDFERRFAGFLDRAEDVLRFSSLGTTEQGESGTQFRVDYLKPSGAIGLITLIGWSSNQPKWATSTGLSKPRAASGRARLQRTRPLRAGASGSAVQPMSRGDTSVSIKSLSIA